MEVNCDTEDGKLERVLVARPSYLDGVCTPPESWPGAPALRVAQAEWELLCDALVQNGVRVHVAEGASAPGGVYMRDVGKVIGNTVHVFSPSGHRRNDQAPLLEFCERHGLDYQLHKGPAREGADFLLIGDTLHVGLGRRTNAPIFTHYRVQCTDRQGARPPRGPEHLLGGHRKLGNVVYRLQSAAPLGHSFATATVAFTDEQFRARPLNWIALSPGRVLLAEQAEPIIGPMLRKRGVEVLTTPCNELTKMGGGPACLTLPLARQ